MPDFKREDRMIYYCECTGLWGVLPCEEQRHGGHVAITVTDHDACRWLNMLAHARDNLIDGGSVAYFLPSEIAAVLPRIERED